KSGSRHKDRIIFYSNDLFQISLQVGDGGGGHGVASAGIRFFSSTIEIVPSAHLTRTPPGRQMKSIFTFSQAAKVTPWMW
ncbi:MAG: hypothetical protein M0R74_12925, partial [Dehalococcoidia bacterium]|nr:hypothetical protein [Dehalococcoidia bacterium]